MSNESQLVGINKQYIIIINNNIIIIIDSLENSE